MSGQPIRICDMGRLHNNKKEHWLHTLLFVVWSTSLDALQCDGQDVPCIGLALSHDDSRFTGYENLLCILREEYKVAINSFESRKQAALAYTQKNACWMMKGDYEPR